MSTVNVTVKWKKETFENVEVDTDAGPSDLRARLQDLTGPYLFSGGKRDSALEPEHYTFQ